MFLRAAWDSMKFFRIWSNCTGNWKVSETFALTFSIYVSVEIKAFTAEDVKEKRFNYSPQQKKIITVGIPKKVMVLEILN